MTVAALYIDVKRGPYAHMLGVDAWGLERDAKLYSGPHPVVAHPPCGPWGQLAHFCTRQDPECATRAVEQIREHGGILEHPAGSRLWSELRLPRPGEIPRAGLWTLEVDQCRWGHEARKRTWLLMSGIDPSDVGPLPPWRAPSRSIDTSKAQKRRGVYLPHLPKSRRHLTPPAFAAWLVRLARAAR